MRKIAEMTDKAFEEYVSGLTDAEELDGFMALDSFTVGQRLIALLQASGNENSPMWQNPLLREARDTLKGQKNPEVLREIDSGFDLSTAFNKGEILKEIDGFDMEAAFKKDASLEKAFTPKGPGLYQQPKFNEDWKVIPYTGPKA